MGVRLVLNILVKPTQSSVAEAVAGCSQKQCYGSVLVKIGEFVAWTMVNRLRIHALLLFIENLSKLIFPSDILI